MMKNVKENLFLLLLTTRSEFRLLQVYSTLFLAFYCLQCFAAAASEFFFGLQLHNSLRIEQSESE